MKTSFSEILEDINENTVVFNEKIGEDYTFFGVFTIDAIWQDIRFRWKDTTTKGYVRDFCRYIFPQLNDRALCELTKEDFEKVREKIRETLRDEGKSYKERRMHQFEYWFSLVTKAADEHGICPDVLWGSRFQISKTKEEDINEAELVRLRKSLKMREEYYVADKLLTDATQPGENFGLALMFCVGVRDNEACAATFRDVKTIDGGAYSALWIYKSGNKDSRESKYSGKTKNANRIVPIPNRLKRLLDERKAYLRKQTGLDDTQIKRLPIACKGVEFDVQCRASEIGYAGTRLLREASVDEDMMMYIDADIEKETRLLGKEQDIIEKDPTAYLFRRNFATHLYILGLTDSEIQYIMGHDIEDVNDERKFYRNEEKLLAIAKKMENRPIVNDFTNVEVIADEPHVMLSNVTEAKIVLPLPANKCRLNVQVNQREPHSTTSIQFDEGADGTYYCTPNKSEFAATVNITATYKERYDKQTQK